MSETERFWMEREHRQRWISPTGFWVLLTLVTIGGMVAIGLGRV